MNSVGLVTRRTDPGGSITYAYDTRRRVSTITESIDGRATRSPLTMTLQDACTANILTEQTINSMIMIRIMVIFTASSLTGRRFGS
ncbi:MAG: hypothetical protein AB2L24_27685 [Mangrovibacterium sp.]